MLIRYLQGYGIKLSFKGGIKMKRLLSLSSIFLFLEIFAVYFTVYPAYADDATTVKGSKSNTSERQVEPAPAPEPVEGTTVKSSKSNSQDLQVEATPAPEPVEGTTVNSGKSNSSERQAEPAPSPGPADESSVKSGKSNSSD